MKKSLQNNLTGKKGGAFLDVGKKDFSKAERLQQQKGLATSKNVQNTKPRPEEDQGGYRESCGGKN